MTLSAECIYLREPPPPMWFFDISYLTLGTIQTAYVAAVFSLLESVAVLYTLYTKQEVYRKYTVGQDRYVRIP